MEVTVSIPLLTDTPEERDLAEHLHRVLRNVVEQEVISKYPEAGVSAPHVREEEHTERSRRFDVPGDAWSPAGSGRHTYRTIHVVLPEREEVE